MEDVYEASPWKLEQIEADLEQESIFYFLAVDEGQVLGFVAIQETLYEAEFTDCGQARLSRPRPSSAVTCAVAGPKRDFLRSTRVQINRPKAYTKKCILKKLHGGKTTITIP